MNPHGHWQILPRSKKDEFFKQAEKLCGYENASMSADVLTFMIAMDQTPSERPVSPASFELAGRLIEEEYQELQLGFAKFRAAQSFENMAEMVDGACDLVYVILWAMLKFNIPFDACFAEVQRSNMAKLQADGTPLKNEHGKVLKPAGWTPPDIHSILTEHCDDAAWNGGIRNE